MTILRKARYRIFVAIGIMMFGVTAEAQQRHLTGNWIWKSNASKKTYRQFRLLIRQNGNTFSGVYSVDDFVAGVWQGEDGNQTPFVGRWQGSRLLLEFDPLATQPGYEQNVSYVPPADGRKPSVAELTVAGASLRWRLFRGPGIDGIPAKINLRRERTSDRVD